MKAMKSKCSCYVMSYHSVNRLRFDFFTCILVLFDCIFIPFKVSFGLQFMGQKAKSQIEIVEYFIDSIFFLDLILGFCRAYINEKTGDHVTSHKLIAIKYLKFYFWFDLLGCLPFDLLMNIESFKNLS